MSARDGGARRLKLVGVAIAITTTVPLFAGLTSVPAAAAASPPPALQRWQQPPIPGPGYRPAPASADRPVTGAAGHGSSNWTIKATPNLRVANGDLAGVSCASARDCQAVGSYTNRAGAAVTLAERWDGRAWIIEPTPNRNGAAGSALSGVTCLAANSCTAVGGYIDSTGLQYPLAETWDGTAWKLRSVPNPAGSSSTFLSGVTCTSSSRCVAVGASFGVTGPAPLAEAWNGTRWKIQSMPSPANGFATMSAVSCSGPVICVAVGSSIYGTLAEAWNGQTWSVQVTPNPSQSSLSGVDCLSATNCQAVGGYVDSLGTQRALAEAWNGVSWRTEATSDPAGASASALFAVSCPLPRACVAVGSSDGVPLAETLQGSSWILQTIPAPNGGSNVSLYAVSCARTNACRAVGSYTGPASVGVTLAEGWNGLTWAVQNTENPLGSVGGYLSSDACVTATACEAVGYYFAGGGGGVLAEVWNGTSWRIQTAPEPAGATSSELTSVACTAANACTAVGFYFGPTASGALSETWNGTGWKLRLMPNPSNGFNVSVYGVSCPAANACTAVGSYFTPTGQQTLAETWNGRTWRIDAIPTPNSGGPVTLDGVSCSAATACMAVGNYFDPVAGQVPLAESWNGTSWQIDPVPVPSGAVASALFGISCTAANACTAGGGHINQSQIGVTLVETWDGTNWTIEPTPNPAGALFATLYGMSCGSGHCTAVGSSGFGTMAEAWNGTAWKLQSTPDPAGSFDSILAGVACTAATTCTAVGASVNMVQFQSTLAEAES